MIADFYNIFVGNDEKLVPNFFDKEKYVLHYENLQLYLSVVLKLKKNTLLFRTQSIPMVKPYVEFNKQNIIEVAKKMETQMEKCFTP